MKEQWRRFLKKVSRDLPKDKNLRTMLPKETIASAWLGYEGATKEEIFSLEKRLGTRLPPSYRCFLSVTNGWRNCGYFIYKLWPCSEVRWFRERNQAWIDAYVHPEPWWPKGQTPPPEPPPLTDKEYLTYGDKQDSCKFRTEYLQTALEISDIGDSAILLLNPEIVNHAGEWEAWMFANWHAGAVRYRSFWELIRGEYKNFCRLLANK